MANDHLMVAVIEAVKKMRRVIENKGSHPEYHDEIEELFREKWPLLWDEIDTVLACLSDYERSNPSREGKG